jgi:competence protein ComEC
VARAGGIPIGLDADGLELDRPVRLSLLQRLARQLEAEYDRWILWVPVAFGAGVAVYFALPREPPAAVAMLPVVVVLALRIALAPSGLAAMATSALLAASLGFAGAKLRTELVRAPVIQERMGPIDIYGFVELVEPRPTKGQRLTIRVTAMEKHETGAWPERVRVRTLASSTLKPGDAVRVRATLNPPPPPSLPGGYDFARTAWFSGLGAVGYTAAPVELRTEGAEPPLPLLISAAIARVRQEIGRRVVDALPGQAGAIANALITGERGAISEETNQAFRNSGLFHILSISGLHMVIMAGAVFFSIRLLLAAIPAIALRYPIKKWAAVAAMLGALGYLMISGAASATVRSYIMISIMFLAVLLDRPALELRNVALSALLILVLWPESLLDPGFQMSFAAVVALVSAYEWLRRRDDRRDAPRRMSGRAALFLGGIVTSTLVAGLAVAPFGIYHFHNTQQFAILANLLAIPICNFLVMPAALATLVAMPFGLEAAPLAVMGWGIEAMVWCAETVAALPGAVGRVPVIPTAAFALIVTGGLWCALWSRPWRMLGAVPVALGILLAPYGTRPDVFIGRDGGLVAVRGEDGKLSAIAQRTSSFELARWLEHDADARAPADVARAEAFKCDPQGCVAWVKGRPVAVAAAPAALRDDCGRSGILVLRFPRPEACRGPLRVIDTAVLAAHGAHTLSIQDGKVRVETVAGSRGVRPWAPSLPSEDTEEAAERSR